jgi:hypothetical protein
LEKEYGFLCINFGSMFFICDLKIIYIASLSHFFLCIFLYIRFE